MSSSGNFNSEFDTYLLTSVKYGVQRRGLYKEFSTAMFMGPAAAHKWARLGLVSIRKGRPVGERAASYPPLPREAGALRLSRAGLTESTEGEFFLIMLQPFHSPCLLQLLLPNNTLSSVTADVPSLLWSPRPAYTDSHTLTIIPHCFFLSHLFPCLCFFTAPQWARFFFQGGVAPFWNWEGVLYIGWDPQGILPVAQPWKPAYAAWAAAAGPFGPSHGLLSSLDFHPPPPNAS